MPIQLLKLEAYAPCHVLRLLR